MTTTKLILITIIVMVVVIIYIFQINEKEQKEIVNERKEELYKEHLFCVCQRPKLNGVTCFECGNEFKQR
jgi:uncharacterized protein YpmS